VRLFLRLLLRNYYPEWTVIVVGNTCGELILARERPIIIPAEAGGPPAPLVLVHRLRAPSVVEATWKYLSYTEHHLVRVVPSWSNLMALSNRPRTFINNYFLDNAALFASRLVPPQAVTLIRF